MKIRSASMLFAALLLASACASCGEAQAQTPADTSSQNETAPVFTEETETSIPKLPSSVPETLDLGGETINTWYFTKNSDAAEHFVDLMGDPEGDIVDNVLYERNLFIEETLNVHMNYVDTGVASGDVGTNIRKLLIAGDTTYDLYNVIQWNCSKLALEHCFLNLSDAPYLDISQPWWSKDYIDAISIGNDNIFFLAGDISLDMIRCIASMYYNKALYANLYDDANGMYETVLAGKWTYDLLQNYIREAYSDVNGDGTVDDDDQFGLMSNSYNNIDAFTFGAGTVLTKRDKDNLPYMTVNDVHNIDVYTKLYEILFDTVGAKAPTTDTQSNVLAFSNGKSLFVPGFLYTSENLRDMKDDYGILPFPKYDESQADYISCVHNIATLMCLPTTCQKIDAVCAVLESMAYYSYYNVTPVYYETALKTKYTRDDISSQIIDLIHDSGMTDLAYVYNDGFNSDGMIMRTLIAAKNKDYASYVAKREKAETKAVEKFIKNFTEANG